MKRVLAAALLIILVIVVLLSVYSVARAEETTGAVPVKITGYCLKGTTASGVEVREGICAYKREDIGKLARVYNSNMELIGEFEIEDTGKGGVRKGTVVDIWKPTKAECYALTQSGYIEVVDKEETEQ